MSAGFAPETEVTVQEALAALDQIIADATRQKFILAPLAREQVEEFVKIQSPPKS